MSLPVHLHSGLKGAPTLSAAVNGSFNALFFAALVNGFNTQAVSSATAADGVVTFNFATDPGFPEGYTIANEGASNALVNGQFRVKSASGNQVLVDIPGVPDGAVGGTILMKFAPLGWTRAFVSGTTVAAYRQGGGAAHKRFLRVYDATVTSANNFYIRGYENMTAINSGTGPFPTTSEKAGNGTEIYTGTSPKRPWIIVGTPRFFYFVTDFNNEYADTPPIFKIELYPGFTGMYFGELDRVQKAGDTYAYVIPYDHRGNSLYGSRAYTLAANTRPAMSINIPGSSSQPFAGLSSYPDPVSGNLIVNDAARVYEVFNSAAGLRGYFPGMLSPDANITRLGGPITGTIFTGFPGVTGRLLLMAAGASDYMVKLDEDWGDI